MDQLRLDELIGPVVVLDPESRTTGELDYVVGLADLELDERRHGPIEAETCVLVRTDWSRRWLDETYFGRDATGRTHYPSIEPDLAHILISRRRIRALGIDSPSPDAGTARTPLVHEIVLGADRYLIENLTNLEFMPARGAALFVLPIPFRDGTGSPARVIGVLNAG